MKEKAIQWLNSLYIATRNQNVKSYGGKIKTGKSWSLDYLKALFWHAKDDIFSEDSSLFDDE